MSIAASNVFSVGDGVYLFSQMESVYWIARRYDIPFLMVVLNNGGWNAPKVSALLVHKNGLSSKSNRRGKFNGSHPSGLRSLINPSQTSISPLIPRPITLGLRLQPEMPGVPQSPRKVNSTPLSRKQQRLFRVENVQSLKSRK